MRFSRSKHAGAGLLMVTLLGACATNSPAPIIDRTGRDSIIRPPTESSESASTQHREEIPAPNKTARGTIEKSPASELLKLADQHLDSRDYDSAAAVINRAIQIAPEEALCWHKLAQLHYAEGRLAQALSVAKRSNALPNAAPIIRRSNWRLIESIERANGNSTAADAAAVEAAK